MAPDSKAIRRARKKAGKSRLEIASALNVSERSVYRWERGDTMPATESLIRLARVLRCNPEDLVTA